jgi:hypothetical protein
MKKFKYKFTKLITALIYVGLVLCVVGFAINLYLNISVGISSAANPVYPILQYVLMYFVTVVLFTLLISILLSSYYAVDDKYFITCFGLIKSKYKISDVELISLDRATNKLSVTFADNSYIVIVVKDNWYNDFVEAILAANPKIEYSIISKENKKED